MSDGYQLNEKIDYEIKYLIRKSCSPRHVPYRIIGTSEIPYTLNGKKVEIAVKRLINGSNEVNYDSIINPESLLFYKNLKI